MRTPPKELIRRVGWVVGAEDGPDVFEQRGAEQWELITSLLPDGFEPTRVLDFGCGVGRILRHVPDSIERHGTDIDGPSIEWLAQNTDVLAVRCGERPPLPYPDHHFDLIWAFSVFTHLTDSWSEWLAELHRVLRPGGVLVATAFGPGHSSFASEPVNEELVGMNVMFPGAQWDTGGPLVLHSRWWLAEHWGRAFEIERFIEGSGTGAPPLYGQSGLVLRPKPGPVTAPQLERVDHADEREWRALRQQADSLGREAAKLMDDVRLYADSRSWALTRPLRAVTALLRRQT